MDFVKKSTNLKIQKVQKIQKKYILWKQSISEIITLISKKQEI